MERCDHEGTIVPVDGSESISHCSRPREELADEVRDGRGTVRIVDKPAA
jgi:hypothetical protein